MELLMDWLDMGESFRTIAIETRSIPYRSLPQSSSARLIMQDILMILIPAERVLQGAGN